MKDFLIYLVTQLIDEPKQLKVEEKEENGQVVYYLQLAKDDMGKVIGKNGKIIHAIRSLVKVLAVKENKLIRIELVEDAPVA